jgi:hypothetical protein
MLHPIEIKANIAGVGQAVAALGDPVPLTKRQGWFAEDRSGLQAGGQLTMLSQGFILRIRSGEEPDDSTATLRPVGAEQLTQQVLAACGWGSIDTVLIDEGLHVVVVAPWAAEGHVSYVSYGQRPAAEPDARGDLVS